MTTSAPSATPADLNPGRPLVLAFATQKGGMGKTTLSVLVASWLHYKRGIKVAVLDVDGSQLSVFNQRNQEMNSLDDESTERLDNQDITPYQIVSGKPGEVPDLLKKLQVDTQLVLIDMPGTLDVAGYETAIGQLDYLIVPMDTSRYSVTTGFQYMNAINHLKLLPKGRCFVVFNKYQQVRDGDTADDLEKRFGDFGFKTLKGRIPQRNSYQDADNLSTLFPLPPQYLRNSGLKDVLIEIETFLMAAPNE